MSACLSAKFSLQFNQIYGTGSTSGREEIPVQNTRKRGKGREMYDGSGAGYKKSPDKIGANMGRMTGFEPATPWATTRCSAN